MAAPRLNTGSPNPAPRRTLLSSGPVPTRRVLLKSGDGSVIHPKESQTPAPESGEKAPEEAPKAAAPKTAAPSPAPQAAPATTAQDTAPQAAAAQANAGSAEPSPEEVAEYNRQMEEYNRQMEEYKRQMAAYEAQQAAEAEAARKAAEEEAARKAAEEEAARKAAEEEAARKAAAEEEARKVREELLHARREAEIAQAKAAAAAAAAAAAEAAARAEQVEARAKALDVHIPEGPLAAHHAATPSTPHVRTSGGPALKPAGLPKAPHNPRKGGTAAAALSASALGVSHTADAPAPAGLPKSGIPSLKPAGAKPAPAGLPKTGAPALKPTGMPAATDSAKSATSALRPTTGKPAPAALPKTTATTPKPVAASRPAPTTAISQAPAATPAAPHALKPSGAAPTLKATGAAPSLKPAAASALKPSAPSLKPSAATKPALHASAPSHAAHPAAAAGDVPHPAQVPPVPSPDAAEEAAPLSDEGAAALSPEKPAEAAAPEMTEEELNARDAYISMLQQQAAATPLHKRPIFYVCLGILGALAVGCTIYVINANENARIANEQHERSEGLKKRSMRLERDAQLSKGKKLDVKCSVDDAKFMLDLIVNPSMRDAKGKVLLGNAPVDGALAFCPLLAYAATNNPEIEKMVFNTLSEQCTVISERIIQKLLGDISVATTGDANRKLNDKFRKLASKVSSNKAWKDKGTKNKVLSHIWNAMVLRLTESDIDEIIKLLGDEDTDASLAGTLNNSLDTILSKIDDPARKAEIGDRVFDALKEEHRDQLKRSLARCCSQKALAYYKERMKDKKNWAKDLVFFGFWGDDSQLAYIGELKKEAAGEPKYERLVSNAIGTVFAQNRERNSQEAMQLLQVCFGNPFPDTSRGQELINKIEGVNALPEGSPGRLEAEKQFKQIEEDRKTKIAILNTLAGMHDHPWVLELLDRYSKDPDAEISRRAKSITKKVKENRENDEANKSRRKAQYGA